MSEKRLVSWFPGHMAKAIREIEGITSSIDVVIEIKDARAIQASTNPLIFKLTSKKPRLIILTKYDLSDKEVVDKLVLGMIRDSVRILKADLFAQDIKKEVLEAVALLMSKQHAKQLKRGINPRITRALVIGTPNVGKSTFINRMRKKNVLRVENKPGVTRSLTTIKINKKLELVDTPGLLWPKFETAEIGYQLTLIGAIPEDSILSESVIDYSIDYCLRYYHDYFLKAFHFTNQSDILKYLGESRGLLEKGKIDVEKARVQYLKIIRSGEIKISWDHDAKI